MKIYLDTCCLNRLSDRQVQKRIRQETEAVNIMLSNFRTKRWHWISSSILQFEVNQNPDLDQRVSLTTLLQFFDQHNVGTPYISRNYKDILTKLETEGKIHTNPPANKRRKRKGKVTFADKVKVTFPRKAK